MALPETATLEDVPRLTEVFQACFNDEYFLKLFPHTPEGNSWLDDAWKWFIEEDGVAVYIIRNENGAVISIVLCLEQRAGRPPLAWTERWPAARKGLDPNLLEEFFAPMDRQHHEIMGETEHTYVELVFTHPNYRRKGLATRLVMHAADVVDGIRPLYLDSMKHAIGLYENLGFVQQQKPLGDAMVPMVKPLIRKK